MVTRRLWKGLPAVWGILAICLLSAGCHMSPDPCLCDSDIPRELTKVSLPPYTIEPPDILLINAVRVVPRPPYRIAPLDVLALQVLKAAESAPIGGLYAVDPNGTINLGFD